MHIYRVPLAVPYWTGSTYRSILRSILRGGVIDGAELHALKTLLIKQLGVADAVLCGSGSLALEIALRACGVRPADEVVIPTFCCSAVVLPVLAVGAVPVLADVGAELNLTAETVVAVLTRKTKAIIVPHLFGNPAPIGAILSLAREKNIRVIDDAAQALGATIDDQPVGSFGDLGILSFGAEKICFGIGGGAVISQKGLFFGGDGRIDLGLPDRSQTLKKLLSTLVLRRWRRWTLPVLHLFLSEDSVGPETLPDSYRKESLGSLNAAIALTLMQTLPENIEGRRDRVRAYRELLGDLSALELIPHGTGSACLAQVVRVRRKRPSEDLAVAVSDGLRNAGYEVRGSYVPLHHLSDCSMCVWDQLPHADRVWSDLVELPCEPSVSLDHIEQISAIVKAAITL
jgi:dTDP-4-amino-4,6-dideoxygalactose transaminase